MSGEAESCRPRYLVRVAWRSSLTSRLLGWAFLLLASGKLARLLSAALLGANTTTFTDLEGHSPADNIPGCKILSSRCIPSHERLALAIPQDATFTPAAFGE